INPYLYP
nr:Chain B, cyclic[INPYLYP] peptide [synthetic construct]